MTLQEIRQYVKGRYNSEMSDTEIDEHINEIYRDLSRLFTADSVKESTDTVTVAAQQAYVLAVDTRKIKQVHYDTGNNRVMLTEVAPHSVVYPLKSATPQRWFPYGMSTATGAVRQQFGLDPVPNTAAAGKTLTVLYEPEPTTLSGNASTPEYVPEEFHYLIGAGTIGILASDKKDYASSQVWEQRYLQSFNEIAVKLGSTAKSNFPQIAAVAG